MIFYFQVESEKFKIESEMIDNVVAENQTHMQNESYEFGDNICRTS